MKREVHIWSALLRFSKFFVEALLTAFPSSHFGWNAGWPRSTNATSAGRPCWSSASQEHVCAQWREPSVCCSRVRGCLHAIISAHAGAIVRASVETLTIRNAGKYPSQPKPVTRPSSISMQSVCLPPVPAACLSAGQRATAQTLYAICFRVGTLWAMDRPFGSKRTSLD